MSIVYTNELPNNTHFSNSMGIFTYSNDVSNNVFGVVLFLTLTVIFLYRNIQTHGTKKGIISGMFISWMTAILLSVGGIIQPSIVVITTFIFLGMIIVYYYDG